MAIWIVDDDASMRLIVRHVVEKEGFECREFHSPDGVLDALRREPDLIVLDVMMPGKKGTELCREIRERSRVPIIFVSTESDAIDRVVGLELGGDDYMAKPFHPRELAARIHALLRRRGPANASSDRLVVGALHLDPDAFQVTFAETGIELSKVEFMLLKTFMEQPRKAYTRRDIMRSAYDGVSVSPKTIDSHIRRLRTKFEPHHVDPIRTIRGVGYGLDHEALGER